MNLVPTSQTRHIAQTMLNEAAARDGYDVARTYVSEVDPGQYTALLGVLLEKTNPSNRKKRFVLTVSERLRGHSQYVQGVRTPFAITAHREYMRAHKQGQRAPEFERRSERLAREEAAYTEDDAKRAKAAYERGERDEWVVMGYRIYDRRRQRARRQRACGEIPSAVGGVRDNE